MYDIAIIGAGIIGCSIARELSKYDLSIVLLDRNNDVSCGATKANSGIIHAGYDAPYYTKKGFFNVRGNKMYEAICKELNVPFKRTGSLVCSFQEEDIETLNELLANGRKLGVPDLEIINRDKIRELEPNVNKNVIAALYAPTTGITEPWAVAIAYAENACDNGVELILKFNVININKINSGKDDNRFLIESEKSGIEAKYVINCAGLYADKIYGMVTDDPEFSIHPRRGQYFVLDKNAKGLINMPIFPCSSKKLGKGILIVPTIDGNILLGPDSEDMDINNKESNKTTADGLNYIKEKTSLMVNNIPLNNMITTFAGLRAEPKPDDFIIEESKIKGFINVAGIKSPGLSAAPAIAVHIVEIVKRSYGGLKEKPDFNPIRRARIKFNELSDKEKDEMIKNEPGYGRIICRCETITEAEIIDAIRRNVGATTLNGIKRRVRPGSGRCQGGFCEPRVMEILARELKTDIQNIKKENKKSIVLVGETKDL